MFPDNSVQNILSSWWERDDGKRLRRGRLLKAFIPHASQEPMTLYVQGRTADPTDHSKATFTLGAMRIDQPTSGGSGLPVAAVTHIPGEVYGVFRAKKRPAVAISVGGPDAPKSLRAGSARWQSAPAILVAPYYGSAHDGRRGGWNPAFLERIKAGEYPQYVLDWLPINGGSDPSVLRLDHVQPVGRHPNSYELDRKSVV